MKLAILGASGIGKYHLREFLNEGCQIVSILGSSEKSSEKTAKDIKEKYGINVKPYHIFSNLLKESELDAVSICTPPETHEIFIRESLEKGINILCEKPLILGDQDKVYNKTLELLLIAKEKGICLTTNTQWPSILKELNLPLQITRFYCYMESEKTDKQMTLDLLPHADSLLVKLIQGGECANVKIIHNSKNKKILTFDYIKKSGEIIFVGYEFSYNPSKPRKVEFTFNEKKFTRKVKEEYTQFFETENDTIEIQDPLRLSISQFIQSINKGVLPLISYREILEAAKLQDKIMENYHQ
jgi:hypothetical protein